MDEYMPILFPTGFFRSKSLTVVSFGIYAVLWVAISLEKITKICVWIIKRKEAEVSKDIRGNPENKEVAEDGFEPATSGL
jgi:hypothetical protein